MDQTAHRHLVRLNPAAYQGRQFVHWAMTLAGRRCGWLDPGFHRDFRELSNSSARSYDIAVPAYCLMPDHMHLVVAGMVAAANQVFWAKAFRRALNVRLKPLRLQKQAYDRVLRPEESRPDGFAALVHYLGENPLRAKLVTDSAAWPYQGSCVPALPDLDPRQPEFHERWWTLWNSEGL